MSGLRDELAALHWDKGTALGAHPWCAECEHHYPCATAALLDRFPPEAEGEAGRLLPCGPESVDAFDKRNHPCGCFTYFDLALWRSVNHVLCPAHTALAASPEEQDR